MQLSVLTPERSLVGEEVSEVYAPGTAGQLGILPDHVTFLGSLAAGEVRYQGAAGAGMFLMSGGVVEVVDNQVTILADMALRPDEVDHEVARRDMAEAEERLASLDPFGSDHAAATVARDWARVRLASALSTSR
jgi:F-type H+-transporting ATPase subunit epsilon